MPHVSPSVAQEYQWLLWTYESSLSAKILLTSPARLFLGNAAHHLYHALGGNFRCNSGVLRLISMCQLQCSISSCQVWHFNRDWCSINLYRDFDARLLLSTFPHLLLVSVK